METQLNELKGNAVSIVGTLESKDISLDKDKQGNDIVKGLVRVQVKNGNKVNSFVLNVYNKKFTNAGKENKLYNGIVTVMNEYKSIEETGSEETADRVSVNADLSYNIYAKDGNIMENNRLRASTFHRVNGNPSAKDQAIGQITAVIDSYVDEEDSNGDPTGKTLVNAFTVGYNGRVGKIMKLKVAGDLSEQMQSFFPTGSTGVLSYDLFNYVIVEEQSVDNNSSSFGEIHEVVQRKSYVNELLISGGEMLKNEEEALDEDQINAAKVALRKQKTEALSNDTQSVTHKTGFGSAKPKGKSNSSDPFASGGGNIDITDDDLPF